MIKININHVHQDTDFKALMELLTSINIKTHKIMEDVQVLNEKLEVLQAAVDTMQSNQQNVIAALEQEKANLTTQLAEKLTPEELAEVTGRIDAIIADVNTTGQAPQPPVVE